MREQGVGNLHWKGAYENIWIWFFYFDTILAENVNFFNKRFVIIFRKIWPLFFGNFILKTGTMWAMNVDGTSVRCSGLAGSLYCKLVFRNTKCESCLSWLWSGWYSSSLLVRARTCPPQYNKFHVSSSTHFVFYSYIYWTTYRDSHTWERPARCTIFLIIYFTLRYLLHIWNK